MLPSVLEILEDRVEFVYDWFHNGVLIFFNFLFLLKSSLVAAEENSEVYSGLVLANVVLELKSKVLDPVNKEDRMADDDHAEQEVLRAVAHADYMNIVN